LNNKVNLKEKCGVIVMNVIAINESPRKNWNTSTILNKALEGARATTEGI